MHHTAITQVFAIVARITIIHYLGITTINPITTRFTIASSAPSSCHPIIMSPHHQHHRVCHTGCAIVSSIAGAAFYNKSWLCDMTMSDVMSCEMTKNDGAETYDNQIT